MSKLRIWIGESVEDLTEVEEVPEASKTLIYSERRIRELIDEGKLIGRKVGRFWLVQKYLSKTPPSTASQNDS